MSAQRCAKCEILHDSHTTCSEAKVYSDESELDLYEVMCEGGFEDPMEFEATQTLARTRAARLKDNQRAQIFGQE